MNEFKSEDRNMLIETHTLLTMYVETTTKTTEDHEKRLRVVEGSQTKMLAFVAVCMAAAGSGATAGWKALFG